MTRQPAVSGQFYDSDPSRLEAMVKGLLPGPVARVNAKAVLCPHAGLIYSGPVAGAVYAGIVFPETFVLLGPNHTGLGSNVSIMPEGKWEIPTGTVIIDESLSSRILENVPIVIEDSRAHRFEHSLEVQLPFITHFSKSTKIVPITIMSATLTELKAIGEGLAKCIELTDYPVVVAASSDMSHFMPDEEAREIDRMAIEAVLDLDPDGLYNVVVDNNISMCGYMPAVAMLSAARALKASEARLIKYTTSAEVSGDYSSVVGYAGIVIK
jgi:AmmeMemoRadiSam system protein B